MPINMSCPSCGKTLSAPDSAAGKRAKCPSCGQIMIVPGAAQQAGGLSPRRHLTRHPCRRSSTAASSWLDELDGASHRRERARRSSRRHPGPAANRDGPARMRRNDRRRRGEMPLLQGYLRPAIESAGQKAAGGDDATLTPENGSSVFLFAGIGCIVGIVYAIQGKPKDEDGRHLIVAAVIGGMIRASFEHGFR